MKRRLILIGIAVLVAAGIGTVLWHALDWPPVRLILTYGFPPAGGPTGQTRTIEGIDYVELKPGYFRMGSHRLCHEGDVLGRLSAMFGLPWGDPPRHRFRECPVRWVEIPEGFWVARTEVTNAAYERFSPDHHRRRTNRSPEDSQPATYVRYGEAEDYCRWLTQRHPGTFRIPTEEQWEYACRAGTRTEWFCGDDPDEVEQYGWIQRNSWIGTHEAGEFEPNPWGLLDLYGNANEWCDGTWTPKPGPGPRPQSFGVTYRLTKGGYWCSSPIQCRSASRSGFPATLPHQTVGFRPVFTIETER